MTAVFVRPGAPLRKHMPGVKLSKERRNALAARDALVEANLAWCHQIAANVARLLPTWFVVDDLIGPAELALLEVAARYDPDRGVPFQAYAYLRVQGACFSSVRRKEYRERAHQSIEDRGRVLNGAGRASSDVSREEWAADRINPNPEQLAQLAELKAVWVHVAELPAKHKRVIQGIYGSDMTNKELAQQMGLSEGRISAVHYEALGMLRAKVTR